MNARISAALYAGLAALLATALPAAQAPPKRHRELKSEGSQFVQLGEPISRSEFGTPG